MIRLFIESVVGGLAVQLVFLMFYWKHKYQLPSIFTALYVVFLMARAWFTGNRDLTTYPQVFQRVVMARVEEAMEDEEAKKKETKEVKGYGKLKD